MFKKLNLILMILLCSFETYACEEIQRLYGEYGNLNLFTIDRWNEVKEARSKCSEKSYDNLYEELKKLRIKTLEKFKRLGIKEEGGVQIDSLLSELSKDSRGNNLPSNNVATNISVITPPPRISNNPQIKTSCLPKTLSNDAVNFSNTRNQDSIGWCYAFAASDMLSFKLNKRFSAISFVDTVQNTIKDQILNKAKQGSDVKVSMTQTFSKLQGLCLESSLNSTDFEFCEFKNIRSLFNYLVSPSQIQNQCQYDDISKMFPSFDGNEFNRLSNDLKTVYIEDLIKRHCAKDLYKLPNLPQLIYKSSPLHKKEDIFNEIEKQIDSGMPSTVAYNVRQLQGLETNEEHASLIMGRAINPETNECEYLVRNSWGKTCIADEGSNPNGLRCHQVDGRLTGYFYVSREKLKQYTSGVYYFK